MPVVEATLVKRYVDQVHEPCGMPLMELKDEVPLGKVYRVDLGKRTVKRFFNSEHGVFWETECVPEVGTDPVEWLPVELLMREGRAL